ncbi:BtrH N-terminal domain-containing protein [Paenibacillus marchantiophytorum]|nr:BtrH N-terminal domain-containing protein [Paenibacillus marchantiophytorum]
MKNSVENVPRYYETYINDCFAAAYGACLAHQGHNPNIVLADYLSFMFNEETGYMGTTYMYRYSTSVEFTESELNSSLEFAYFPKTTYFNGSQETEGALEHSDRIQISLHIHDDPEVASDRVRELIDGDKPVAAVVDLYYMSYHRAYLKEHGLHAVVITGYDYEQKTYDIFDKYLLSSSDFDGKVPMDAFMQARLSDTPRISSVVGEYRRPIRHLWMEFDTGREFQITKDKLLAILQESYTRMRGEQSHNVGETGLGRIDAFRKSILLRKEQPIDETVALFFREYYNTCLKRVARGRNRFLVFVEEIADMLPQEAVTILGDQLRESAKRWDICANLALKLAISKAPRLLDDLERNLQAIIEIESRVVEQLRICMLAQSKKESDHNECETTNSSSY